MIKLEIISGRINKGKSLYVRNLVQELTSPDVKIGGIISVKNEHNGYDAHLIHNGKYKITKDYIKRLAWSDEIFKNFSFNKAVFEQVYEISLQNNDVFIIDEVGQLEIIYKQGFHQLLKELINGKRQTLDRLIVSVKSKMLSQFFDEYKLINKFNDDKIRNIILNRVDENN